MPAPGVPRDTAPIVSQLQTIVGIGVVALVVAVATYVLPAGVIQAHAVQLSSSSMLPGGVLRHGQWSARGDVPSSPFDCADVSNAFRPNITVVELSSYKFNLLRRKAYMHDRSCYEEHLDQFSKAFLLRRRSTGGRHYNLHLPKSGGTSLCRAVLNDGFKSPNSACHNKPGCAAWCCCSLDRPRMACDVLSGSGKYGRSDWVSNENYLDHPLCLEDRLYSATIRDPISRAISHFEHYLDFMVHNAINGIREEYKGREIPNQWWGNRHDGQGETARRINLIQSNYMSWSLIAGLHDEAARYQAGSGANDLQDAMEVIGSFDFLLGMDVQNASASCTADTLAMMGLNNTTLGHEKLDLHRERGEGPDNYQYHYRRSSWARLNDLDVMLYEYIAKLIRADCAFFARIVQAAAAGSGLTSLQFHKSESPPVVQTIEKDAGRNIVVSGKLSPGGASLLAIP
jgi:hypothetical protein